MMNKDVSKKLVKNAICELCDYEEYDNAITKEQRLDILHKAKESLKDAVEIVSAMELRISKKK